MPIQTPVFLVGAPRSGITLLCLMLDHHPQLAFHDGFEFAVDQIDAAGNYPKLTDYYEYLTYQHIFQDSPFKIDRNLNYSNLIDSFLLQKRAHKSYVGASARYHFDKLLSLWPQARFIHLLRDGRDVADSITEKGYAGNIFAAADYWLKAEQLWEKLRTHLTPAQQLTVRYEDLVQQPEAILTHICQFIGIPFDANMFYYAQHSHYDPPDSRKIGQWRQRLTAHQIQLAESKMAPLLTERSYPLSGLPLLSITPWQRWRLHLHTQWAEQLLRLRRYSLGLYCADLLSRHLHLKSWQKQVRARLSTRDAQFLK